MQYFPKSRTAGQHALQYIAYDCHSHGSGCLIIVSDNREFVSHASRRGFRIRYTTSHCLSWVVFSCIIYNFIVFLLPGPSRELTMPYLTFQQFQYQSFVVAECRTSNPRKPIPPPKIPPACAGMVSVTVCSRTTTGEYYLVLMIGISTHYYSFKSFVCNEMLICFNFLGVTTTAFDKIQLASCVIGIPLIPKLLARS